MQHPAKDCNTLQHPATPCNTMQHNAISCNPLQPTATHCNPLQHTATHCNSLQHTATQINRNCLMHHITAIHSREVHFSALQHTATNCNTLQHTATQCTTSLSYILLRRTCARCTSVCAFCRYCLCATLIASRSACAVTHSYVSNHSYVCHDSFIRVPWLIHRCAMTHSYMCNYSLHQCLCELPVWLCATAHMWMSHGTHLWMHNVHSSKSSDFLSWVRHSWVFFFCLVLVML
jgi:hypothetical protein